MPKKSPSVRSRHAARANAGMARLEAENALERAITQLGLMTEEKLSKSDGEFVEKSLKNAKKSLKQLKKTRFKDIPHVKSMRQKDGK